MTIRQRLPWPVRIATYLLLVILGVGVIFWVYTLGSSFTGANGKALKKQLSEQSAQLRELGAERDALATKVNAAESQLNIERSTGMQLANQMRVLESENVRLKEDLAFFESLLPTNLGTQGIAIQRLRVDLVAPGQLRYRLLVLQGGKAAQQPMFTGSLQLVATVVQSGRSNTISFPDAKVPPEDTRKYKLSFKYYQRVEGTLVIPEGATVKSVQVRVVADGQVRAQQTANL